MPIKPFFRGDKLETLVRQCILFPADGSGTRIVHMVARTVTVEDIASLSSYSRCVDMSNTFGDEYRKTRVMAWRRKDLRNYGDDGVENTGDYYLFFYNLSPKLPVNLNIANKIGATLAYLKYKKRLFWRGDVVVMKVRPEVAVERLHFIVESMDADLTELGALEECLWKVYLEGGLERLLRVDELQWHSYVSRFCWPTSLLFGAPGLYWGSNAAQKEEYFLDDLNELRCAIGRTPLRPHVYMHSYTKNAATLYAAVKFTFGLHPKMTGPPKLPQELELRILELCAFECPEMCTVLVLVAKRVYAWIDPILIETVILEDCRSVVENRDVLGQFLVKVSTGGKPVGYYSQHIRNLAFFGAFSQNDSEVINRILDICGTGAIENLVLLVSVQGLDFFENPQSGRNLRRLTIQLDKFKFFQDGSSESMPNFYHPCFTNLTHLHLYDDQEKWPNYTGWERLINLTHLAFAHADPAQTILLIQTTLHTSVRYVVIGNYDHSEMCRYSEANVNNAPDVRAKWPEWVLGEVDVVVFGKIPQGDWEKGRSGRGDFWDVAEWEAARRREEQEVELVDHE